MKSILRKILFAKSYLYRYPYSSLNLSNHLERIYKAGYVNRKTILRGKESSTNEFLLWEKWNFFRGIHSFVAISFFSGTTYNSQKKTYIIGTIYPNPLILFAFYFPIIILCFIISEGITKKEIAGNFEFYIMVGLFITLSLLSIFYFRRRIRKSVENELQLKNETDLINLD